MEAGTVHICNKKWTVLETSERNHARNPLETFKIHVMFCFASWPVNLKTAWPWDNWIMSHMQAGLVNRKFLTAMESLADSIKLWLDLTEISRSTSKKSHQTSNHTLLKIHCPLRACTWWILMSTCPAVSVPLWYYHHMPRWVTWLSIEVVGWVVSLFGGNLVVGIYPKNSVAKIASPRCGGSSRFWMTTERWKDVDAWLFRLLTMTALSE